MDWIHWLDRTDRIDRLDRLDRFGPGGSDTLSKPKEKKRNVLFLASKFNNLENPTLAHTNPIQEQNVTKSDL